MEWATQWHGVHGKVHADKRTIEYSGQGNHSTDAACFVGAKSVGTILNERVAAAKQATDRAKRCLQSPFGPIQADSNAINSDQSTQETNTDSASTTGANSHQKSIKNGIERKKNRKKRRVDDGTQSLHSPHAQLYGQELPVYYFEVVVLATKHFQGDEDDAAVSSIPRSDSDDGMEDHDDEDGLSDALDDVEAIHFAVDHAPWRGRARRLVHDHLRATSTTVVSSDRPPRPTGRGNAQGTDTNRSTAASPPRPPPNSSQDPLLSFPLTSSTIQQIRLRLERQQQEAQLLRRRLHAQSSQMSDLTTRSISLSSAITSLHVRHRRESARRKRSNHRISIGFQFADTTISTINGGCEELGRQARSVAFVGRNGSIQSNGHAYQQTDKTFGVGDTVGCGVILDTRTFFWTVNGVLVETLAATEVHHLDDMVDDSGEGDWLTSWALHLRPSVSLHDHGECVRATFTADNADSFVFDVAAFVKQRVVDRQHALRISGSRRQDEEEIMHQLVEDYLVHYGYGDALDALRVLHPTDRRHAHDYGDSVAIRHRIRQLIYRYKTHEALLLMEQHRSKRIEVNETLVFHCQLLSVVDHLQATENQRHWDVVSAMATASKLLQPYLARVEDPETPASVHLSEVKAFMSALLYRTVDEIPATCPGRRYLVWSFREQVADAMNALLLDRTGDGAHGSSALETLVDSLSDLQRDCLNSGLQPFPPDNGDYDSSWSWTRKRRHAASKSRANVDSEDDDSDGIVDGGDGAASSDASSNLDDSDDEEEEEGDDDE